MKDIPRELWHPSFERFGDKKTGGPNLRLLRLDPDLPSNTITGYVFNKFVHPSEDRYITPREAARIQQFPDSHVFCGPITSIQQQIGNAVPIGLSRAIAAHLSKFFSAEAEPSAISLFSGAGGLDLGFQEWFKILAAVENDSHSCETLRSNFSEIRVVAEDIKNVGVAELGFDRVDLVFGGPPCQPFSAAGKQRGVSDPRGALVDEYFRLVRDLSPKYFILENVQGLVYNQKGGALSYILDAARKAGYETEWRVLHAENFGVPQFRRRLVIIGRQKGLRATGFPDPTHGQTANQLEIDLLPVETVGRAFEGLGKPHSKVVTMA
jgi:DNA (cytosine-5)-methyltransferase 1